MTIFLYLNDMFLQDLSNYDLSKIAWFSHTFLEKVVEWFTIYFSMILNSEFSFSYIDWLQTKRLKSQFTLPTIASSRREISCLLQGYFCESECNKLGQNSKEFSHSMTSSCNLWIHIFLILTILFNDKKLIG